METKVCNKCGIEKSIDEFRKAYNKKYDKYYYRTECHDCELRSGKMEIEKTTEKILKIIRDTLVILMFVILFIGLGYEGTFIKEGSSPLLDFINKYIYYSGLGPLIIAVIGLIISYIIGDVDPIAANNFKHSKKTNI